MRRITKYHVSKYVIILVHQYTAMRIYESRSIILTSLEFFTKIHLREIVYLLDVLSSRIYETTFHVVISVIMWRSFHATKSKSDE